MSVDRNGIALDVGDLELPAAPAPLERNRSGPAALMRATSALETLAERSLQRASGVGRRTMEMAGRASGTAASDVAGDAAWRADVDRLAAAVTAGDARAALRSLQLQAARGVPGFSRAFEGEQRYLLAAALRSRQQMGSDEWEQGKLQAEFAKLVRVLRKVSPEEVPAADAGVTREDAEERAAAAAALASQHTRTRYRLEFTCAYNPRDRGRQRYDRMLKRTVLPMRSTESGCWMVACTVAMFFLLAVSGDGMFAENHYEVSTSACECVVASAYIPLIFTIMAATAFCSLRAMITIGILGDDSDAFVIDHSKQPLLFWAVPTAVDAVFAFFTYWIGPLMWVMTYYLYYAAFTGCWFLWICNVVCEGEFNDGVLTDVLGVFDSYELMGEWGTSAYWDRIFSGLPEYTDDPRVDFYHRFFIQMIMATYVWHFTWDTLVFITFKTVAFVHWMRGGTMETRAWGEPVTLP